MSEPKKVNTKAIGIVVVVVISLSLGLGFGIPALMPKAETEAPINPASPTTNTKETSTTVSPALITSVTLEESSGNVLVAFEQSDPSFTPSYKLYRKTTSFSESGSAEYIKTVTYSSLNPTAKVLTDTTPPAGTWYYGIVVRKPVGLGLLSPLSNVMSVVLASTGPVPPPTPPAPEPVPLKAPSLLDVADMQLVSSVAKVTIMVTTGVTVGTSAKLFVYASTVEITSENCGATFIGEIAIPAGNALITSTITLPTGFKEITTGYIAIRTVDGTSISPLSNLGLLKWTNGAPPAPVNINLPVKPTNVRLVENDVGIYACYVTLQWDASPNAVSYDVWDYQRNVKLSPTSSVYGTSQYYQLNANYLYSLEVRAVNFAGTSAGAKYGNVIIWEPGNNGRIRYIPISSLGIT